MVGLAGEGEVGAGVLGEGGGAGGVVLLQRIITQLAVLVPADRLLRARREGGQGETQTYQLHRTGQVVIIDQAERVNTPATRGPGQEVTEQRPPGGWRGLGTGPGETDLGQEVLALEVAEVATLPVTETKTP